MDRKTAVATAMLAVLVTGPQAFQLHGKVVNAVGRGVVGAVVTLVPLGFVDTTGADGGYSITGSTSISGSGSPGGIALRGGILEIPLAESAPLRIDVLDTRGRFLQSEVLPQAPVGVHRWDVAAASAGNRVVVVRVQVGERFVSFPRVQLASGDAAIPSAVLARAAAVPDSLSVVAAGYLPKKVAVPSLDGTLDVALDTSLSGGNPAGRSAGCGRTPTLSSGSRSIQVGSDKRDYMLRIPAGYDNQHPYPLVFAFHWNGGTMGDVDGGGTSGYTWSYYGMREAADTSRDHKMIFITPQGIGNGWANSGGRDLNLVDNLLNLAKGDLCVDTTRIFSMGFSYGGGMTFELACARAKVFRAAAVYAGAQLSGCDDGTKPIAYIGIHGLRDPTCGIGGGRSLRDKFVKNNGCPDQTVPEPAANSLKHVCTTYSGCKAGYPVRWCAFDGGGHTPAPLDGQTSDYGGGDKTWTKKEVWDFFTQF